MQGKAVGSTEEVFIGVQLDKVRGKSFLQGLSGDLAGSCKNQGSGLDSFRIFAPLMNCPWSGDQNCDKRYLHNYDGFNFEYLLQN